MTTLLRDICYSLSRLGRDRSFTAVAVLTLAITLGANTAIFSVMNGVLLRALPYPGFDRIMSLTIVEPPQEGEAKGSEGFIDLARFEAWPRSSRTIEQVAAYSSQTLTLSAPGDPERLPSASVSATLFPLLQVAPVRGRDFRMEEQRPGLDRVVILSYGLWQRRFGTDPKIVGKTLVLDGAPFTVLGVMPSGFFFPDPGVELWTPLATEPASVAGTITTQYLPVIVRLRDGVSLRQAEAEGEGILKGLGELSAGSSPARVRLTPIRDEMVAAVRPALLALSAAVGLVLLIACINVAGLLLVRSSARQREMAIRSALGASRARLVRQALTESTLLALLGGICGLVVAAGLDHLLPSLLPQDFPRLQDVHFDARVFLFALALAGLTGLLCGLLPAVRSSGSALGQGLQGNPAETPVGFRSQGLLVMVEIALAFVVLVTAGLLLQSFLRLVAVEPGFEPKGVLTATLDLDPIRYSTPGRAESFFAELLGRLAANPEVKAAGVVSFPPLTQSFALTSLTVVGQPQARIMAVPQLSSAGYLRAMKLRLASGRWLSAQDETGPAPVAVVNQTFVRRYLTGDKVVGRQVKMGSASLEIIGVVKDVHLLSLDSEAKPEVFTPYTRAREVAGASSQRLTLAVRTAGDPLAFVASLRRLVLDLDPGLPLADVGTMDRKLAASVAQPRLYALLLGAFAAMALGLAAAGVYGVLSYSVARQTRAIGISRALGAPRSAILAMVLCRGSALVSMGLAVGFLGAVGAARLVASLLFGVGTKDPLSYLLAALVLIAVTLLACIVPARRALAIDPGEALRYDR